MTTTWSACKTQELLEALLQKMENQSKGLLKKMDKRDKRSQQRHYSLLVKKVPLPPRVDGAQAHHILRLLKQHKTATPPDNLLISRTVVDPSISPLHMRLLNLSSQ